MLPSIDLHRRPLPHLPRRVLSPSAGQEGIPLAEGPHPGGGGGGREEGGGFQNYDAAGGVAMVEAQRNGRGGLPDVGGH